MMDSCWANIVTGMDVGGEGLGAGGYQGPGDTVDQALLRGAQLYSGRDAPDIVYRNLGEYHGLDRNTVSNRLHSLKEGLPADSPLYFDLTGNVYNGYNGEWIGQLTDPTLGGYKR